MGKYAASANKLLRVKDSLQSKQKLEARRGEAIHSVPRKKTAKSSLEGLIRYLYYIQIGR